MNANARTLHETDARAPAAGVPVTARLTDGQRAALARLGCVLERPGSLAVVCGPAGTGVTMLLRQLEAAVTTTRTVACRTLVEWESVDPARWPDVVIADDVHEAADGAIGRLLARVRAGHSGAGVVLAGRGRVFTLLARDRAVESQVSLRAVLHPFTAAETAALLAAAAAPVGVPAEVLDPVALTIHEIAGGVPAAALRLAEMALLVASSRGGPLEPADVEVIHRRVSLTAA
jgi:type II secretory pathway predicted ATPase ExeA